MANLDTLQKRSSAVGEFGFVETLAIPDGTIDTGDRVQVAWCYVSALYGSEISDNSHLPARSRHARLSARTRHTKLIDR